MKNHQGYYIRIYIVHTFWFQMFITISNIFFFYTLTTHSNKYNWSNCDLTPDLKIVRSDCLVPRMEPEAPAWCTQWWRWNCHHCDAARRNGVPNTNESGYTRSGRWWMGTRNTMELLPLFWSSRVVFDGSDCSHHFANDIPVSKSFSLDPGRILVENL